MTATATATITQVGPDAVVTGNARVVNNALVYGHARVGDNARVEGNALVFGRASVYGDALVFGRASVYGRALVYGNTRVYGRASVGGNADVASNDHVAWVDRVGSGHSMTLHRVRSDSGFGWQINAGCVSFEADTPTEVADLVRANLADTPSEWAHVTAATVERWRAQVLGALAVLVASVQP